MAPQIKEYRTQTSSGGVVSQAKIQASDIGGGEMANFAARATEGTSNYLEKQEEFEARKAVAQEQIDAREELSNLKRNAQPGAPGFDEQVNEAMNKRREAIAARFSGGSASRIADAGLSEVHSQVKLAAYEYQAESAAKKEVFDITNLQEKAENFVRANPSQRDIIAESQMQLVAKMNKDNKNNNDATLKMELADKFRTGIYDKALDGEVTAMKARIDTISTGEINNMMLAMKKKDSEWQSSSKGMFDQKYTELELMKAHVHKRENDDLKIQVNEAINQLGDTNSYYTKDTPKDLLNVDFLKRNFKGSELATVLHHREAAIARGDANTTIAREGLDAARNKVATFNKIAPQTPGYDAQEAKKNALVSQIKQADKNWEDDSGGTLMNYRPVVAQSYNEWVAVRGTPQGAVAFQKYAKIAKTEAELFNPGKPFSYIPKAEKDFIKAKMEGLSRGENNSEAVIKVLTDLNEDAGPLYHPIISDMVESKHLTPVEGLAGKIAADPINKSLAADFLSANTMKPEELERLAPAGSRRPVQDEVFTGLQNWIQANGMVQGANKANADMAQAITNTVLMQGGDAKKATAIVDTLVNSKVTFHDDNRFWVPKSVDGDAVEESSKLVLREATPTQFTAFPTGDKDFLKAEEKISFNKRVKDRGYWVTQANSSGLRLITEDRTQVYEDKDGQRVPVQRSWAELQSMNIVKKNKDNANFPKAPTGIYP